jgi:hypothetical protein
MDVPIWHCPQLSFYTYPASVNSQDLNESNRAGKFIPGCKHIDIIHPERPSDQVHCHGDKQLSELFVGALGTAVDDTVRARPAIAQAPQHEPGQTTAQAPPSLVVAPAWGNINGKQEVDLEPLSVVGTVLEDVEEDWVKA